MTPFDDDVGDAEKIEQILRWLDLPAPERPGLVMSWWHGADHVGHQKGPDHPDVERAMLEQDRLLGRLLAEARFTLAQALWLLRDRRADAKPAAEQARAEFAQEGDKSAAEQVIEWLGQR